MNRSVLALFTLSFVATVAAASNNAINTAGNVLLLGVGARGEGLGGCGALLGEAYSGLFNPAGLVLISDVAGSAYLHQKPYMTRGNEFVAFSAAAHSEFGYIGANYLSRQGVENSDLPPEEVFGLTLTGRAWKRFAVGGSMKILSIQKYNAADPFVPLNEPAPKTFKTIVDVGVLYHGLWPWATLDLSKKNNPDHKTLRARMGRPFPRGFTVGAALLNLGGRVEYSETDVAMLPQTFRADLLWGFCQSSWFDLRLLGAVQKLLVRRNEQTLGYENTTQALFNAWGTDSLEGGWTVRTGAELSFFGLLNLRGGWSRDYGAEWTYYHAGLGLGPEWLRANAAFVKNPDWEYSWWEGARYDLTVNLRYDILRKSLNP